MRIQLPAAIVSASTSRLTARKATGFFDRVLSSVMKAGSVSPSNSRIVPVNSDARNASFDAPTTKSSQETPQQIDLPSSDALSTIKYANETVILRKPTTLSPMESQAVSEMKVERQPSESGPATATAPNPKIEGTQAATKQEECQTTNLSEGILLVLDMALQVCEPASLPMVSSFQTPEVPKRLDATTSALHGSGNGEACNTPQKSAPAASQSAACAEPEAVAGQDFTLTQSGVKTVPESFTLVSNAVDANANDLSAKSGSSTGQTSTVIAPAQLQPAPLSMTLPVGPPVGDLNLFALQTPGGKAKSSDTGYNLTTAQTQNGIAAKQTSQVGAGTTASSQGTQDSDSHTRKIDASTIQAAAVNPQRNDGSSPAQATMPVTHAGVPAATATPRDFSAPQNTTTQPGQHIATVVTDADGIELPATSAIHTSTLLQTMSGSEMRVGLHSIEFGDISIRTSISQQQVLAQISVNHGDLGRVLAEQISTAQTKISEEHGLRASIEVHRQEGSLGAGSQDASRNHDGAASKSARSSITVRSQAGAEAISAPLTRSESETRLDIRA